MPEQPIVKAMAHIIQKNKGAPYKKGEKPNYHLEIFPMIFAFETVKKKSESSNAPLTINREGYSGSRHFKTHPNPPIEHFYNKPSNHSLIRSHGQHWEYLLNPNEPGPLFCESRGKLLVIAAGNHALIINFSLEAHVVGLPRNIFIDIVSNDIPSRRRNTLRSFLLPSSLIVPNSLPPQKNEPRTLNIHAAFVSEKWVWAVVDFSRLLRLHVISRDDFWSFEDLQPSSPTWPKFFERFKGGPDWVHEKEQATTQLDIWRKKIISKYNKWETEYQNWEQEKAEIIMIQCQHDTFTNAGFCGFRPQRLFEQKNKNRLIENFRSPPAKPYFPIIKAIMNNNSEAFSGYGRFSANDILYQLAIFPTTPCDIICRDDNLYNEFKAHLHTYMMEFSSPEVLNRTATVPNRLNPLSFNEESNHVFLSKHVNVFRRKKIMVPKGLYEKYAANGYFDRNHTIGFPYASVQNTETTNNTITSQSISVNVNVHHMDGLSKKVFSIFEARIPSEYGHEISRERVSKDITQEGYKSTIGFAQFHDCIINRVLKSNPMRGRPKKERTGKPGRPPRIHPTIRDIENRLGQGRKTAVRENNEIDYDDMDIDETDIIYIDID